MAAQRTIVWTVFPSILVLHILARGVGKTVVIGGLLVTLFIGYDVADWLLAGNDIVGRLGRFTDRASDEGRIASLKFAIDQIAARIKAWQVVPTGSEGYRTAEVTLGGIATDQLDQQTMAATGVPGLYVIGEAAYVTGWLGGYNFQCAWSSGWAAGQSC